MGPIEGNCPHGNYRPSCVRCAIQKERSAIITHLSAYADCCPPFDGVRVALGAMIDEIAAGAHAECKPVTRIVRTKARRTT